MTNAPEPSAPSASVLRIQAPCPKRWEELSGAGARRFCGECELHVHDAAQMTKSEARALVASATARVCMRIEHDEHGAPVFRDTRAQRERGPVVRAARWAMTAVAGVLAACTGSTATTSSTPTSPAGVAPTTTAMGRVCAPATIGDVAPPPAQPPERARATLGEAVMGDPAPPPPPSPEPPRDE